MERFCASILHDLVILLLTPSRHLSTLFVTTLYITVELH